ncbi:caspase family protein [Streptomyces sp. WAC 06783]|uniref:caspase family protein n=1 Tax=Streptomyces sp. WAC 06783 TaxID=2203211 RepID=UPI000F7445EF|nr:caspase family protein [Streptomyces sp. WAC 06783]
MTERALLIGCRTGALRGVHADVRLMDSLLTPLGFETTVLVEEAATRQGIIDAYRALTAVTTAGDTAVVYYTGHGARLRKPGWTRDTDLPDRLQYLCPTDIHHPGGTFRGLLAEELSLLQWELGERTRNVTTILDCCHAARMSRDPALLPKADTRPAAFGWNAVATAWRAATRAAPTTRAAHAESHPSVVRLVACAPEETAFELVAEGLDGWHGALTGTLARLLCRPGSEALTWDRLIALLRPAVTELAPGQRPEVAGPTRRFLFELREEETAGALPVRLEGGAMFLDGAELFGIGEGDRYAIVAPGSDRAAPPATATVDLIADGRARLRPDATVPARLLAGLEAHPVRVALGRRPVAVVPPDHPEHRRVARELGRSPFLRVSRGGEPVMATVALDDGLHLLDPYGAPLLARPYAFADGAAGRLTAGLHQLARATHLRTLGSGTGTARLDGDVAFDCVRLLADGGEEPLAPSGAHLFNGDEVVVRLHNRSSAQRYVSVFDIGLRGAVTLLSTAEPSGIGIEPDGRHELFRLPASHLLAGVELYWPDDLPAGPPRPETFVGIVTDRPQNLSLLAQPGVLRPRTEPCGSELQSLVEGIAGGVRDGRPPTWREQVRYAVRRFDFHLHPGARPAEEPPFAVDERPDLSFRLVAPRSAAPPPAHITAGLRDLTLHSGPTLGTASVRIDSLVVTRPGTGHVPYRAATHRVAGARDGERLPVDRFPLYEGPVGGSLDLAVWLSPDDGDEPPLDQLLATETGAGETARAVALLATADVNTPGGDTVGAVATLMNACARLLSSTTGQSIGVFRTTHLPHERYGATTPGGRHPETGLLRAPDLSFAYEIGERLEGGRRSG